MKLAPKKVGDKALVSFIAKCVVNDWCVLTPVGDCDRFDCVIDRGSGFERIQVKNGRLERGSVTFNVASSHYHTKQGQVTKNFHRSYAGQIEAFGVWCASLNACYIVPVELTRKRECSLRVDPTNQVKRVSKWAKDFQI